MSVIGAIDQGTTSTRVIIFDRAGTPIAQAKREFKLEYPNEGYHELNPELIYATVLECLEEVKPLVKDLVAVGITNQRETTIIWDKTTGKPLHNAIIWSDLRTQELVDQLVESLGSPNVFRKSCGLPISTYFSAMKIIWLIRNSPDVRIAIEKGNALFGTVDTWLIWKLTGEHVTDVTNASRTMLMNLRTLDWDKQTCNVLGIPVEILPKIKSCSEKFGVMKNGAFPGVPVMGCIGDQQAATLGHLCLEPGSVKSTFGTGAFLIYNTGNKIVETRSGLLQTACFKLGPDSPMNYALEGSIASAASTLKWLKNLGVITSDKEVDVLCKEDTKGEEVVFVNALNGFHAPYWNPSARGAMFGLTERVSRNQICRASVEAVAFMAKEVFDCLAKDIGAPVSRVKVDGGMSQSNYLLAKVADITQTPVERPQYVETTALGAAFAAGLASNFWTSVDDLKCSLKNPYFVTTPSIPKSVADAEFTRWKISVNKSLEWTALVKGGQRKPFSFSKFLARNAPAFAAGALIGSIIGAVVLSKKH